MALIKCPECGKEISDKAEFCPHCGIKFKKKMECKNKICKAFTNKSYNFKKLILPICVALTCICLILTVLFGIHFVDMIKEQKTYDKVLQAHQSIIEKYGNNIEPIEVIYCYRDMEINPPSEFLNSNYDTGFYVYITYNIDPEKTQLEQTFLWHDGNLLFEEMITSDIFYSLTSQLKNLRVLDSLVLLSGVLQKEVEDINNKIDGCCKVDVEVLKKYAK